MTTPPESFPLVITDKRFIMIERPADTGDVAWDIPQIPSSDVDNTAEFVLENFGHRVDGSMVVEASSALLRREISRYVACLVVGDIDLHRAVFAGNRRGVAIGKLYPYDGLTFASPRLEAFRWGTVNDETPIHFNLGAV